MGYTKCITMEMALYFDLFDDINYKWLKEVLDPNMDKDEYDFEVEIEDMKIDIEEGEEWKSVYCKTKFTFDLRMLYDESFGEKYYHTKSFTKIIEYNGSSGIALTLMNLYEEEETETEEEEDEEVYGVILKDENGVVLKKSNDEDLEEEEEKEEE